MAESAGVPELVIEQPFGVPLYGGNFTVGWGSNAYGQLTPSVGLKDIVAIAAANSCNLALMADGTVAAWGSSMEGASRVPAGLTGVQAIACGPSHALALKWDGTVVAWGENTYHQSDVPDGLQDVKAIAVGGEHSLALKLDGTVVAWGYNAYGQSTVPPGLTGVQAIAAGEIHSIALLTDGTVVTWGYQFMPGTRIPAGLSGVKAIAAAGRHCVALKNDGTIAGWGEGWKSQSDVPGGLADVRAISTNLGHTVALGGDGTVWAWGINESGQTNVPLGLNGVLAVAAGRLHTIALLRGTGPSIAFGNLSLGGAGLAKTFTLKNTGIGAIAISSVTIAGQNPGEFHLDTTGMLTDLPEGAETTLTVACIPTTRGNKIAILRVASNDPKMPAYEIRLGGTGVDTLPPVITKHADVSAKSYSSSGAVVFYDAPVVNDAVDPAPTVISVPASGSLFPRGSTAVHVTATDATFNRSTSVFYVTVSDGVPPTLDLPRTYSVNATSALGAIVDPFNPARDESDPKPVVEFVPALGTLFPIGNTTVQVTATDADGNSSRGSFVVRVRDLVAPLLHLITPAQGKKFTGSELFLSGKATDNFAVARVEVVFDGGAPLVVKPAGIAADFAWTLSAVPESGMNSVVVTAYDLYNNASLPVVLTFSFVNIRAAIAGSYSGLLTSTSASLSRIDHEGLVNITVLSSGNFTGKVTLGGTSFPITGLFLKEGGARFGRALAPAIELATAAGLSFGQLALTLNPALGSEKIAGTLTKGGAVVGLLSHADRAFYTAKKNPLPVDLLNPQTDKGQYTGLILPGTSEAASEHPKGTGWARMKMAPNGTVRITGKLADGSIVSCGGTLSQSNEMPVYVLLYGKKGLLSGPLLFDPIPEETDASSTAMRWYKRANAAERLYPAGWPGGIIVRLAGSKFLTPPRASGLNALQIPGAIAPAVNAVVSFFEGPMAAPTSNDLSLAANNKATEVGVSSGFAGVEDLRLSISGTTGAILGSFTHSGTRVPFSGMLHQKSHTAGGYFLYYQPVSGGVSGGMVLLQ